MSYAVSVALPLAVILSVPVIADQTQDIDKFRETLKTTVPFPPESIRTTPIPGLYEVVIGPNLIYFSADAHYMLIGDLVDAKSYKNLSTPRRNETRLKAISGINESDFFIFAPEKGIKHTITIFTDIDCGYCQKLHRDVKAYNDKGIKIRYAMFPRAGKDSSSYKKAVDAWCASDRNAALTRAKNGESLEHKDCPNPVSKHMAVGEAVGVTGTPTIVTDTGDLIPGYVTPNQLAKMLDDEQHGENQ